MRILLLPQDVDLYTCYPKMLTCALDFPVTASDDKSICMWDVSAVSVGLRVLKAKRLQGGNGKAA